MTLKVVRTTCKLNAVGRVIRNRNNLREHIENSARGIQTSQIYFAVKRSRLNSLFEFFESTLTCVGFVFWLGIPCKNEEIALWVATNSFP